MNMLERSRPADDLLVRASGPGAGPSERQDQAEHLLARASEIISRALSHDSRTFINNIVQEGGQ